jgi:hypothetical protein
LYSSSDVRIRVGNREKEPPLKKEERGEKDTHKERRGREETKRHTIREG